MRLKLLLQATTPRKYFLAEVLQPENFEVYAKQPTGEKYLVNPSK
ncbi:MAG: hypothetical protein CM1200mP12_01930 [Gammaproteobacteria bacterium]|nr:MAG: hypothetical protein CM1200mP12_01930 [Gammaproteobacteria bacterium]